MFIFLWVDARGIGLPWCTESFNETYSKDSCRVTVPATLFPFSIINCDLCWCYLPSWEQLHNKDCVYDCWHIWRSVRLFSLALNANVKETRAGRTVVAGEMWWSPAAERLYLRGKHVQGSPAVTPKAVGLKLYEVCMYTSYNINID